MASISNVYARETQSLNGSWRILIDAYDRGDGSRFGENRTAGPSELVEYSFASADALEVPGDWNTQRPDLYFYEGSVWYQRDFGFQSRAERRTFLHFGAANYRCEAFVNGTSVGTHEGGYTPFSFEIGPALSGDGGFIVVKVDNRHGADDVPTRLTDWLHYGGLTRDVLLVQTPITFVRDFFVQLAPGRRDRIAGWLQLDGSRLEQTVRLAIPELELEAEVRTNAAGFAEIAFDAEPELWSPESPRLYTVLLEAETDRVADTIGFRTIEQRGGDIVLNGKSIFLRGISLHEEALDHPGRAHSPEDAESLLELAKELGCNFVRLAHYPHNEHTVRCADRLGLLVWSEIPLYWGIDWANPKTLERARQQLSEIIERDHNRAAVVLWSISNETAPSEERNRFLGELISHARRRDSTRLLTSALFGGFGEMLKKLETYVAGVAEGGDPEPPTISIEDPLAELLDVLGWNQYLGWYYSAILARRMELDERQIRDIVLRGMPHFTIETPAGKPLIVSEMGAGAQEGRHGDELEIWTEEYQARVYRAQLAMLERAPALRGLSPWILKDFRTPVRVLPGVQDGFNRKGLVSECGDRKLAFSVLRDFYAKKAVES